MKNVCNFELIKINKIQKKKHGFIDNTATDEENNPRTTGFKRTKVDIGHQYT